MKYKFMEERLYLVRFLDHCMGHDAPLPCTVVGFCVKNTSKHVVLIPWVNSLTKERNFEGDEVYCIVKPLIIEVIDLRRTHPIVPQ